ncbi:FapA family protein [Oscillospiraceae bacterium MB08-C2-2]|nr:FapA family protein [Oscillospiraceae bacterium MB08-C2-2]
MNNELLDHVSLDVAAETQEEEIVYEKPAISVNISYDQMMAAVKLTKTSVFTSDPQEEDIRAALAENRVVFGIKEEAVKQLCILPIYDRAIPVAEGKKNQVGEDGRLEYLIREEKNLAPKIREDGTADFKDLGVVQNVKAGQELCRIIPPTIGEEGTSVLGEVVPGQAGRAVAPRTGKNVSLNEEGTAVIADCDGSAEVLDGKIVVLDVLRIAENVDNSTGDITFTGNVIIGGDVRPGFTVTAQNITVRGSVEGATLNAAESITISQGVNGANRGRLIAGGDIRCPYLQAATVEVKGNLYADSILYCQLNIGGNLELTGKRGSLIGGRTTVGKKAIVKNIGADFGTTTEVSMKGMYDENDPEVVELRQAILELQEEQSKVAQVLGQYRSSPGSRRGIMPIDDATRQKLQALEKASGARAAQLEGLEAKLRIVINQKEAEGRKENAIQCSNTIYPGVKIAFGPYAMAVSSHIVHSMLYVSEGEIKTGTL